MPVNVVIGRRACRLRQPFWFTTVAFVAVQVALSAFGAAWLRSASTQR